MKTKKTEMAQAGKVRKATTKERLTVGAKLRVTEQEPEPSEFGQHAANPTGDADNDTPREGVGNQDEDHPSDHADSVGGAFSDEECAED